MTLTSFVKTVAAIASIAALALCDPALAADRAPALMPDSTLQRIAVGSCLHQARPQPIWQDVIKAKPQVMLMMGDNVYGDFRDALGTELKAAYDMQQKQPEFSAARAAMPMLGIWDDHDYGRNDGGVEFEHKLVAAKLFHEFWGSQPERPLEQGIHYSRTYGPGGRRVQIIFLDTRSFRSPLKAKTDAFPHWGKFEPSPDLSNTVLGPEQWAWFEAELQKPADLRLIVSSIQVLAEGHGWERWGNFPHERERFLNVLAGARGPAGVVLLSGDRHGAAIYSSQTSGARELVELTSSALNMPPPGPNRDARIAPLVTDVFVSENYGLLDIDWASRKLTLSLQGVRGETLAERVVPF
jgi:alkaline phosphatase D